MHVTLTNSKLLTVEEIAM